MALKPDVWPNCELKLAWFDRLFQTADNSPAAATTTVSSAAAASSPNFTNCDAPASGNDETWQQGLADDEKEERISFRREIRGDKIKIKFSLYPFFR
jgi:hypothetical protein